MNDLSRRPGRRVITGRSFCAPLLRASRVAWLALVVVIVGACQAPLPTGTAVSAAGLHFVAPPGWVARLDPPSTTSGGALLGWATNQLVLPACEAACERPIDQLEAGGIIVWVYRTSCLPNCQLPDVGRTLIGGREASRRDAGQACGAVGGATAEAIVVSVTPQRHDLFLVCAGRQADAARAALDRLLASVGWTVP
jgi:hypothetical protein